MNCKEYNEKYAKQREDFESAVKNWLTENPERFIAFRSYIPGHTDNGYGLPCVAVIGPAPGFVDEYFVSSDGSIYEIEYFDEESEDLTEWDRKYLTERKDWDWKKRLDEADHELEGMLADCFDWAIGRWDVEGKITLVDGEIVIDTTDYNCGY